MMKNVLLAVFITVSLCLQTQAGDLGFVSLFDGKSLTGWIGPARKHFQVESGILSCEKGCQGVLFTEREYEDFVLKFEFKLTPGANNGLVIRAPLEGDPAYTGVELQILDNSAEQFTELNDYQFHGSAYGIAPAKKGALKPVGQWNSQVVYCQGRRIKVVLNEKTILDVDLDKAAPDGMTIDGQEHPGLNRQKGYLGFLCHEDPIHFRNIYIKELPSKSVPPR